MYAEQKYKHNIQRFSYSSYKEISQVKYINLALIYGFRIELIRLLIVASGMLSHSSSMAVQSRWILAGTGTLSYT